MAGGWFKTFCIVYSWLHLTLAGQEKRQCEQGWRLYKGMCYTHFRSPLVWREAAQYCRSRDGNLARTDRVEIQRFIEGMVRYSGTDYWLGLLYAANKGWVWEDNRQHVSRYRNWVPLQWNRESVTSGRCGCMIGSKSVEAIRISVSSKARSGMWIQTDCYVKMAFVCQKPPVLVKRGCQEGWHFYRDSCFRGYQIPMTWILARQSCQRLGGDLLTIRSHAIQRFVNSMITEKPRNYWVGLNYNRQEGEWCWLDAKSEPDYTNWAPSLPDSNRVSQGWECMYLIGQGNLWTGSHLAYLGMWNHGICEMKLMFICQKRPVILKVEKTDLKKPAKVNTNLLQRPEVPTSIIPPTGTDLVKANIISDKLFSAVNIPLSLLVIVVFVGGGVLSVFIYIKRPRCRCSKPEKTTTQSYDGLENPPTAEESDYATIGDVTDRETSHPIPPASRGSVIRSISSADKNWKDKHDAVVSELKRQNDVCLKLPVEERNGAVSTEIALDRKCVNFSRQSRIEHGTDVHVDQKAEHYNHSYLDLCVHKTEGSKTGVSVGNETSVDEDQDETMETESYCYLDLDEQKAEALELQGHKPADYNDGSEDMSDHIDVSLSVNRGVDAEAMYANVKGGDMVCIDKTCPEYGAQGDGYETPVRPEGDMNLDLSLGQEEDESNEDEEDSEWEEETEDEVCYEYEEPVR